MYKLHKSLILLDNQPFQEIQTLQGEFEFPRFSFSFVRIQGSPGANPGSIARVKIAKSDSGIPEGFFTSTHRQLAVADFLIRRFRLGIELFARQNRGKDGSGSFDTIALSQKMLVRDSVLFDEENIVLLFIMSLPAKGKGGGVFDGEQAWVMFKQELVAIADYTFFYNQYDTQMQTLIGQSVAVLNNRQDIVRFMQQHALVAFIANGSRLPRKSGIDDKPAIVESVQAFQSPASLEVNIPLSDGSRITGMGIKQGITCISGGGFHGKSTLLQALLAGVYAHIPGDGREYVVTREDAFFIRAEEGRSIRDVDISAFINDLPNGLKTVHFSSDNASGSTSQAADIIEAIECSSRLLLFDEDSCATNFLVRDDLISKVVDVSLEPIKPLYSTVRSLWKKHHISMIFVVGGLGSFLQKADTCLLMDNYHCREMTAEVRDKLGALQDDETPSVDISPSRRLMAENFDPVFVNKRLQKTINKRIKNLRNAPRQLEYGMDLINLDAVPQIVEAPQVLAIGYCLSVLRQQIAQAGDRQETISYWIDWLYKRIEAQGLSVLDPEYPGTISMPRKYELAAAINRMRSLQIVQTQDL